MGATVLLGALGGSQAHAELKTLGPNHYLITQEIQVPGTPTEIYDAFTAPDIRGWWDHSFTQNPERLYIEPRPGGGFYEIFDKAGNGALHATVIYAERGKSLRFTGPLGLSGQPVTMVHTLDFQALDGGKTKVKLSLDAFGPFDEGLPAMVDQVWHHFLAERFQPWIEAGKHKSTPQKPEKAETGKPTAPGK